MRAVIGGSLVIVYFRRYHFVVSSFLLNGINPGYLFLFHWHGIFLFLRMSYTHIGLAFYGYFIGVRVWFLFLFFFFGTISFISTCYLSNYDLIAFLLFHSHEKS